MTLFWIIVFVASLFVLVKGSDWLLQSSEKMGLAIGLSPFIVGVTIVAVGTSFPELVSSIAAIIKGAPEIVAANAIGSNVANILLIVGFTAILAKRLQVSKSLINLDLPLLAIGTVLFLGTAWDSYINRFESAILLGAFIIYILYTIIHRDDEEDENGGDVPSRETRREHITTIGTQEIVEKPKLKILDFVLLVLGVVGLTVGAKYLIDSVVALSEIFNIAAGVITISAVALGTSLPELFVSTKAALQKNSDVALGNIFGSNVFNMFMVVGLPGIFKDLPLDEPTFKVGLPAVAFATLLFVISGISRKIHIWEGSLYLLLYLLFIVKLFNLF